MASSVVRATVRAVSKRKIQATRAALTLVSAEAGGRERAGEAASSRFGCSKQGPGGRRRFAHAPRARVRARDWPLTVARFVPPRPPPTAAFVLSAALPRLAAAVAGAGPGAA